MQNQMHLWFIRYIHHLMYIHIIPTIPANLIVQMIIPYIHHMMHMFFFCVVMSHLWFIRYIHHLMYMHRNPTIYANFVVQMIIPYIHHMIHMFMLVIISMIIPHIHHMMHINILFSFIAGLDTFLSMFRSRWIQTFLIGLLTKTNFWIRRTVTATSCESTRSQLKKWNAWFYSTQKKATLLWIVLPVLGQLVLPVPNSIADSSGITIVSLGSC